MALLKPLELNKAVRHEVLAFGVFKRQNTAESTKFRVAPSAGEKNVICYEKLSKIGGGLYSNICLPFQFCEKEREGQELLRGPKQKKTAAVCVTCHTYWRTLLEMCLRTSYKLLPTACPC